ncbi:DUF2066 domain-containing protein [Bradyrhizobium murdochi]|uniref:DUF2066 domain-containing protein n=1 Tax=Bradyrhizobium murdochi TaxID=1038859 RepID=UPI001F21D865|nr:DUF2066 domain-containing protein [Bradyrhizobium murdochi]
MIFGAKIHNARVESPPAGRAFLRPYFWCWHLQMFQDKSLRNRGSLIVVDLPMTRRQPVFMWLGAISTIVRILLAVALVWCASAMAAAGADLYRAQTVVTGQGEANRIIGFASGLEDVLIKVSGAQKLAGDRRLAAYKSNARSFVRAFSYRDQFLGKPIRDEQGTRDRPYDLTVDFEEKKIDDILKALGLKPWVSHRPRLAVFVGMENGPRAFIVTADGAQSDLQRDALLAAADRRGMNIVLPSMAALAKSGLEGAKLETVPSSTLAPLATEQGGELALVGHLVWSDRELGWVTRWRMDWQGRTRRWQIRGVTFDEAFRRGVGGAAQILSDNGDPGGRVRR